MCVDPKPSEQGTLGSIGQSRRDRHHNLFSFPFNTLEGDYKEQQEEGLEKRVRDKKRPI